MRIIRKINQQIELIRILDLKQYLQYKVGRKPVIKLNIHGQEIWVRKKTNDLEVAISCFDGEFDLIRYLYPKDYTGVIVDAGGYIGTAAIAFSLMYPKATILTIEPSLDNFQMLKKNIGKYTNIKAIQGALVASDSEKAKLRNRNTGEWGFTVLPAPKDCPDAEEMDEVPAFRLTTLGVKIEDIGILKLDIEGGEHDIMTNDKATLQLIPVIFIELHDRIIDGCSELFFSFSKDRIILKEKGEKYLSIKK